MTTQKRYICLIGFAMLVAVAISACYAKEAQSTSQKEPSLASKLLPQTRSRTARSISDMFEKVKSKIFGSKKQAAAAASVSPSVSQPVASAVVPNAQRQQTWDQYNPYMSLVSGNNFQQYQPFGSSGQLGFGSQPVSGISGNQAPSYGGRLIGGLDGAASQQQPQIATINSPQQQQSVVKSGSSSSSSPSSGGLFSSASHLFAQYLSPNSGLSSSQPAAHNQQQQQSLIGNNQNGQLSPQQQNQYNEFASILDSMVAQTGPSSPLRQPNVNQANQFSQSGAPVDAMTGAATSQQLNNFGGLVAGAGNQQPGNMMLADNDMSASSNVQSYLPSASGQPIAQQASQKSSSGGSQMIGLAEQLAPGAQFNKLISFPFLLSNNDDSSKEGRFKLHIPFLNQHVKRSDQQAAAKSAAAQANSASLSSQQQQAQTINQQYYDQQYLSSMPSSAQQQQQQQPQQKQAASSLLAAPSQQASSSVSSVSASGSHNYQGSSATSSSSAQNSPISPASQVESGSIVPVSSAASASALPSSSSAIVAASPVSSSSSVSSSVSVSSSNPSVSSSITGNNRPAWSVADVHTSQGSSSASSSKMIPIQS